MSELNALIEPYLGALVLALLVAAVLSLLIAVALARRVGTLQRRLDRLARGGVADAATGVVELDAERLDRIGREVDELAARTAILEAVGRRTFQRLGLVRFNPFEDTGGNQSFALALLDAEDDGIIVSSLHARGGTRIYAKTLAGGRPETTLSSEEEAALRAARDPAARRAPRS